MNRTQIYISREEQRRLKRLSKLTGKSRSALIRDAIDRYLRDESDSDWKGRIMSVAGMWKSRKDLPNFDAVRASLDRL